ncbi:hypothetical protein ACGFK1_30360 [Mycobacterium sp. NPDC048908]|uniref:hypothetical protein n=1 Tax=Mycobacterium sp. NPDC048908 TaxID=3364292 RepID=UPI003714F6DD
MSANSDPGYSPNDGDGVGDTLRPTEAFDSDDVRNDDGDEVVDPPDTWREADKIAAHGEAQESLDDKLAAERPDMAAAPPDAEVAMDRIDPENHGTDETQISGTPEDGDSFFPVVD